MVRSAFIQSSIGRKVAMALSGFFLITFLTLHVSLNMTSVIGKDLFNSVSHFMGYNPVVQYIGQPILAVGVFFHFVMGFILEIRNRKARPIAYASNNGGAAASWNSRNMIISGLVILAYLGLHWYDFWIHELNYKFVAGHTPDPARYYGELVEKFRNPVRTGLYCLAFVLLGFHLWHGFYSAMQSVGFRNRYSRALGRFGKLFAVAVPGGFILIALFHHWGHQV
jgi:succinate dehydrogenase / fumarate reductase cytochrome b subunit